MLRIIVLTLMLACAASAGSPPWHGPPIITGKAGEQLCAKHREPLQRITIFGPAAGVCILFQPSKQAARQLARSPNALPFGISRAKSLLYSRPVETSYCVQCEEEVRHATARK
jgi:hypothetical protein